MSNAPIVCMHLCSCVLSPLRALLADRTILLALRDLADYAPANAEFSLDTLVALEQAMIEAQQSEARARVALDSARDAALRTTNAFHDAILGAKSQVIAQYGMESITVHAVGLKRKSERQPPRRRTTLEE